VSFQYDIGYVFHSKHEGYWNIQLYYYLGDVNSNMCLFNMILAKLDSNMCLFKYDIGYVLS